MIMFTRTHQNDNCFSEWMRTKNGGIAAVSCRAREKENAALYAYAYTHAILSLFRQYDVPGVSKANYKELAAMMLEYCRYAGQKLDVSLECKTVHPVPYIGGIFTLSDGRAAAFTVGNASVKMTYSDGKKENHLNCHPFFAGRMKKSKFSARQIPMHTVKFYSVSCTSFDKITLTPAGTDSPQESLVIKSNTDLQNTAPTVYRAVITGRRHASKGQYCQDYADFCFTDNGALAAALSDGAGGGNCSEYGAIMNVESFLSCCEEDIPFDRFGKKLLQRIKDTHEELQMDKPIDGIQAYATLMGVYVKDDRLTWFHIGDGAIYGRKKDGTVECISDAENFQVSNRTFFTIEADAADHLFKGQMEKGIYDKIIIMTDGVYNGYRDDEPDTFQRDIPADSRNRNRMDFIQRLFSRSDAEDFDDARLAELIDSEQVLDYGDDHSAILIDWRKRVE